MKDLYTPAYWKDVVLEQQRFFCGESLGSSPRVRPEILESWKRSRVYLGGVTKNSVCLPEDQLKIVLERNKELLNCAIPIINYLKSIIIASSIGIVLTDEQGVLLHVNGDLEIMNQHPSMVLGAVLTEKEEGTNSIGLCLALGKQVEVFGPEHYVGSDHRWCCLSAPLHGGRQCLMGVLTVMLPLKEFHMHTKGMLMMAAKDINDQHHLHDLLSDQEAILELVGIGVLLLDKKGGIKAANTKGRSMLHMPPAPSSLGSIVEVIQSPEPFLNMLTTRKHVIEQDVFLHLLDEDHLHCLLSASPIPNDKGTVVSLYEANRAQQLAVHSVGAKAIYSFDSIIGESPQIHKTVEMCRMAAQSNITTLILGESGTGKELFAHAVHNGSARSDKPFIIVNCGALPRDLIQSELFGYDSGAFTGAQKGGKAGKFELASGGTIFLDEIGDMPLEAQINLLRLIQNGEVTRVGGKFSKYVDVRIIAATNKNLRAAVSNGTFREDLFYRLSVLTIDVLPLRERPLDIMPLAQYFLKACSRSIHKKIEGISQEALNILQQYPWPGNVRELENVIERALNLSSDAIISKADLPQSLVESSLCPVALPLPFMASSPTARTPLPSQATMSNHTHPNRTAPKTPRGALQMREKETLQECLHTCNGNMRMAAQILGIARSALYAKLKRLDIDIQIFRKNDCQ